MKKIILAIGIAIAAISCSNSQAQNEKSQIKAKDLSQIVDTAKNIQLVDVRTPGEFEQGHVKGAVNIDWNGDNFEQSIASLDKNKLTYVYCLSGGRSGRAANAMREKGFTNLVEMPGGMMEWRNDGLKEETGAAAVAKDPGMSQADYDALLNSDKLVLVDFYAEWCGPCKKMKPFLEKMEKEMASTVKIVRIDADAHPAISQALGVTGLPTLKLYKNKQEVWNQLGYISEKDLKKVLKEKK